MHRRCARAEAVEGRSAPAPPGSLLHVAGQQQADLALDRQCLMRQGWIAGAEKSDSPTCICPASLANIAWTSISASNPKHCPCNAERTAQAVAKLDEITGV